MLLHVVFIMHLAVNVSLDVFFLAWWGKNALLVIFMRFELLQLTNKKVLEPRWSLAKLNTLLLLLTCSKCFIFKFVYYFSSNFYLYIAFHLIYPHFLVIIVWLTWTTTKEIVHKLQSEYASLFRNLEYFHQTAFHIRYAAQSCLSMMICIFVYRFTANFIKSWWVHNIFFEYCVLLWQLYLPASHFCYTIFSFKLVYSIYLWRADGRNKIITAQISVYKELQYCCLHVEKLSD